MDHILNLELTPAGRVATVPTGVVVRGLTPADVALLDQPRGTSRPAIKRLRDSHHALARLIAAGKRYYEISALTGYSPERISVLNKDPTFMELVEFYRADANLARADMMERMSNLGLDIVQELQDRIETEPETISTPVLLDALAKLADRTGFSPVAKSVNVNINGDIASRLANARSRVGVVDAEVLPPAGEAAA